MKKREIQKAIVFEWLSLFDSLKKGIVKKSEYETALDALSSVADRLLDGDNIKWLATNYTHYYNGEKDSWYTEYPELDRISENEVFLRTVKGIGREVDIYSEEVINWGIN